MPAQFVRGQKFFLLQGLEMNKRKERMLDILKELKNCYGAVAVKAEFEAEGSRLDELIMLNEVVFRAD